jgi:hypothetical protein
VKNQQELTPWNFCDYRCEVCRYQESCNVFHAVETERRILIAGGKDPDDLENVLQGVGTNLAEALEQVKETARKFGIDPEAAAREAPPERPLADDPLYRKALDLTVDIFRFLEARRPENAASDAVAKSWDNLAWYHTLFPAKIGRALSGLDHADDWDPEWGVPDYRVSAGIALKALDECRLAFEALRGDLPFSRSEISGFLAALEEVRVMVRQRFDQAM